VDSLNFHQQLKQEGFAIKVLPAFRPDKAMNAEDVDSLNAYIDKLESVADIAVDDYDTYLKALKQRHDFFAANGCSISDHGLEEIYAEDYTEEEVRSIFKKIRGRQQLQHSEILKFKS